MQAFSLTSLYKYNARDKPMIWTIGFDGQQLITVRGQVDGKMQTTTRKVTPKAKRNLYEQALQEAQAKYKKKIDEGYSEKLGEKAPNANKGVMLANKYDPAKTKLDFPVGVQPKFDGIRCKATTDGKECKLGTRKLTQELFHLNHIREDVLKLYHEFVKVNPSFKDQTVYFDGELFDTKVSFDSLNGIARSKLKPHAEEAKLRYYIFDIIVDDTPAINRYSMLANTFSQCQFKQLEFVQMYTVNSHEEIMQAHAMFEEQKYEGIMIRKIKGEGKDTHYVPRKSNNLLKYKSFDEDEGIISGATEGEGGNEKGAIVYIIKYKGQDFGCRPQGDVDTRKTLYSEYLKDPKSIYGKLYRFKFQGLGNGGNPRFPVGLGFVEDRDMNLSQKAQLQKMKSAKVDDDDGDEEENEEEEEIED